MFGSKLRNRTRQVNMVVPFLAHELIVKSGDDGLALFDMNGAPILILTLDEETRKYKVSTDLRYVRIEL